MDEGISSRMYNGRPGILTHRCSDSQGAMLEDRVVENDEAECGCGREQRDYEREKPTSASSYVRTCGCD